MQVDVHFYGGVPMTDAGSAGPKPTDRRYGNADVVAGYRNLEHWARTADALGYHTMWLTEHHFQHEGYEVTPNLVQFGLHLTSITKRLHQGQMFNVLPQWHPLRLAEDFAVADILSGQRMVFGVGRGTVPREMQTLGATVASGDNAMSADADARNREIFEECLEVIRLAWTEERFSYSGKHFTFPPPGIPDRGATVTELTLVPRPERDVPVYQPISSPKTLEFAARVGNRGVFALQSPAFTQPGWEQFAVVAGQHGRHLAPGQDRALHLHVHVAPTREEAVRTGRDAHDEFCRFLAPYGRFTGYPQPDGSRSPFGFQPTLEDSMREKVMAIGSVDDVVDTLGTWIELLDVSHLVLFADMPGLSREQLDRQLELVATEVLPQLGVHLPA